MPRELQTHVRVEVTQARGVSLRVPRKHAILFEWGGVGSVEWKSSDCIPADHGCRFDFCGSGPVPYTPVPPRAYRGHN